MASTTLLVIFLFHAIAGTMKENGNQTTDSTYKWTTPLTRTMKTSGDITNEFYQDTYTTNKWIDRTESELCEQNCTGNTLYPSPDYEETSTSSLTDVNASDIAYRWTNTSFPTRNPLPGVPVVLLGVGTVVMVVNALVMVAFVRNAELRRNTNHNLVMGLSLSDFLMGLTSFVVGCRLLFPKSSAELVLCILENICGTTSLVMSLFQTFCISLHRFLVLSENVFAQHLFEGNGKYYIYGISWATAFTLFSSMVSPERENTVTYEKVFGRNVFIVQMILCSLGSTLMVLTLIFYALAIYQVWKRYMKMSSGTDAGKMEYIKQKRIIKSIKLVSKILLVLFVCSGPFSIALMFSDIPYAVSLVGFASANINSLLNPLIYWSHISQLRNEFKAMFHCET